MVTHWNPYVTHRNPYVTRWNPYVTYWNQYVTHWTSTVAHWTSTVAHWNHYRDSLEPAMPPDVRRGCASPFNLELKMGCAPGSGFARIFLGQRPNQGPSPQLQETSDGAAQPRLTSGGIAGTIVGTGKAA